MAVQCTNCGHLIPSGQFRCGKCGHVAARESLEDFSGLADLGDIDAPFDPPTPRPPAPVESLTARLDEELIAGRESIVPKGTFASDLPTTSEIVAEVRARVTAESDEKPGRRDASGPLRSVPPPALLPAPRPVTEASTQRVKAIDLPARPPFLASEILREDLSPREPGEPLQRMWLRVACAFGLLAVGLAAVLAPPVAAVFVGVVALLTADRLVADYVKRAMAMASIGGASLMAVVIARLWLGGSIRDSLLAVCTVVLSSALLLRAWHRASTAARIGVGVGSLLGVLWAATTSSPSLLALDFTWHSWLPAVCWYVFGVLALLSLLAFMGDETTAGCDVWAGGLLSWYALNALTDASVHLWGGSDAPLSEALSLAEPTFAAACAIGLAQLAANHLGRRRLSSTSIRPTATLAEPPATRPV